MTKPNSNPTLLSIVDKVQPPDVRTEGQVVLDALRSALKLAEEGIAAGVPPSHCVICFGTFGMKGNLESYVTDFITGNISDLAAVGMLTTVARDLMGG